jgi:hypothetical protein
LLLSYFRHKPEIGTRGEKTGASDTGAVTL